MHKAIHFSNFRHFVLSLAAFSATFQELHPSWFLSTSIVLLHDDFGFPLFLLPLGAQVSAISEALFPESVRPTHLHRLILMSSEIGDMHTTARIAYAQTRRTPKLTWKPHGKEDSQRKRANQPSQKGTNLENKDTGPRKKDCRYKWMASIAVCRVCMTAQGVSE